ncbi:MAG: hypothetical protein M0010_18085 [Actinomycetota bacterium]|nr:hypothetical protein [Actinomycetota bacterium]
MTDAQKDPAQPHPMIEATKTSLAEAGIEDHPAKPLADALCCSEENLAAPEARTPTCTSRHAT